MGAIALLGVDDIIGPAVAQAALARRSQVEHLEGAHGLRRLASNDGLDAVVVGPSVGGPVQIAQQTCLADPDLSVLLLSDSQALGELSQAVRFAPLIGDNVRCAAAGQAEVAALVDEAITRTRQRRRHRQTVDSLNAQIALGQSSRPPRASQELLGQLLQHLPVAVISTDADGRIHAFNSYAEQLFLVAERDALGKQLEDLLGAEIGAEIAAASRERAGTRRVIALGPDFRDRKIEVEAVSFSTRTDPSRGLWLAYDVTAREQAEEDRRDATRRLQVLASAGEVLTQEGDDQAMIEALARLVVPVLADVCFVDLVTRDQGQERRAVACADPALAPLAERLRRPFRHEPGSTPGVPAAIASRKVVQHQSFDEATLAGIGADPEEAAAMRSLQMQSSITAPLLARGQVLGALTLVSCRRDRRYGAAEVALAQDLAARAALALDNAALYLRAREDRDRALEASTAKDEFLAMLGHELRNPLAPIVTALQLMKLRSADVLRKERAVIERQVKHLTRLVDDLLDVSRITLGKVALKKVLVEVADVVNRAVELSSPLFEQHQHHLSVAVPRHGLALYGDATRLSQVLSNLLNNAAKYTPRGGHIEIAASRNEQRILLTVRDDGMGIAPEMLTRVFDRFAQERQGIDRSVGGLGLGLAIVKSLVAMHDGTVSVISEGHGRGSVFTVDLPAAPAVRAPAAADARPRPAGAAGRGRRVLVVDDNADARDLLAEALRESSHVVAVAHDGPSALLLAGTFLPQVALLDIGLPVMDGYELARRLRSRVGSLRLIAVTGYGQPQDRETADQAGFDALLVKPVALEQLESAIAMD